MLQIAEENVMADTVKAAEDGNGIIVRIYETWGMRTKVHVNFPLAPDAQVTVCDCMENFSGGGECGYDPCTGRMELYYEAL